MADAGMAFEVARKDTCGWVDGFTAEMTRNAFISTLEETLGVPPDELRPSDTRDSVKGWSSLTDVTILTIIFSELGIEAEDDLLDYKSVGELLEILDRKRAFADS
jgi:acyl carrier protein